MRVEAQRSVVPLPAGLCKGWITVLPHGWIPYLITGPPARLFRTDLCGPWLQPPSLYKPQSPHQYIKSFFQSSRIRSWPVEECNLSYASFFLVGRILSGLEGRTIAT